MNTPNHFFTGYLLFIFLCTTLNIPSRLRGLWEPFFGMGGGAAGAPVASDAVMGGRDGCVAAGVATASNVSTVASTARNSTTLITPPVVNVAAVAAALEGGFTYYPYFHPLALMCACFACLPDWMEHFFPSWEHATWSHMLVFSTPFCLLWGVVYSLAYQCSEYKAQMGDGNSFWLPVGMGYLSMLTHYVCDICTHQKFHCDEAVAHRKHIYLYPFFQDVSFHLDCLFGWSYFTRVILEWAIYMPILYSIVLYRGCVFGQNPLHILGVFSPRNLLNWNLPLWCVSAAFLGLTMYSGF